MSVRWVIDYEALNAWSTFAAAVGTIGAVVVALWQAAKARKEATGEQKYRNWLEQKRLEEQHLTRTLQVLDEPYRLATDFFFSRTRLLAGIPANIAPTPEQEREVLAFIEGFARESRAHEGVLGSYINIVAALRELHRARGETTEAEEYDKLLQDVTDAFNATSDLREWLADVDTIRSLPLDGFFDLPLVAKAREATNKAARTIARRLVRLYEKPPSG